MAFLAKEREKRSTQPPYVHSRYETQRKALRFVLTHIGFRFLAKFDAVEGLEFIPEEGPGIVMINHIALIDPVVVLGHLPRNVVPLGKIEAFRIPLIGTLARIWGGIPVHREEIDRQVIRLTMDVLKAGELILLAPEGTRNPDLRGAREGVAYLALKADAPVIPVAISGTQGFPWIGGSISRKPGIIIRIGQPFHFRPGSERRNLGLLRQMTDEAMYRIARMLPENLRGEYADLSAATVETLEFLEERTL
jgi:1-acyl-sn-glycerol-3-phosphate acyltransferase